MSAAHTPTLPGNREALDRVAEKARELGRLDVGIKVQQWALRYTSELSNAALDELLKAIKP